MVSYSHNLEKEDYFTNRMLVLLRLGRLHSLRVLVRSQ